MKMQTTETQWREFVESLQHRKSQLLADLNAEDYSETQSVEYSLNRQIGCINILLEQVPAEFFR